MPRAVGGIDGEPLLISAIGRGESRPGLPVIERSPDVIEEVLEQTEVKELPRRIGVQYRIAAKDVGLQGTGVRP